MIDIAVTVLAITALVACLNARLLKLPMTIGVMACSMALSLALAGLDTLGLAPGLRLREQAFVASIDFSAVLMQGMLPVLLFAGALHVDVARLRRLGLQVGLLAFAGTAVSTFAVGGLLWAVLPWLGLPLPLIDCLLFGALISPTDPIAVLAMLKSAHAPADVAVVIAGESLFNDGVGVVIFAVLLGIATQGTAPGAGQVAALLLQQAGGGLVFGAGLGLGLRYLLRTVGHGQVETLLTLAVVLGGYALANHLHLSGPLAMVVAGLVIGGAPHAASRRHLEMFWERLDDILNAVLFALVGLQVVAIRWPVTGLAAAIIAATVIVATLATRWATVALPLLATSRSKRLPRGSIAVLTWGGLRGGISIALALGIPADHHPQALVAMTYGVVAFAVLVQGLTFGRLSRRWLA